MTLKPMPCSLASQRPTQLVGHRGASGLAPENTLAAFQVAADLRLDGVEFDVQRSSDGHLVVVHDDELDRTSDGHGPVGEKTLAQLQALDAGSWFERRFMGERIPTLAQVFDLLKPTPLLLYVELKDPARYPGMEAQVADLIRQYGLAERCQVRSFDHDSVRRFQALAPDIATSELWYERMPAPEQTFTGTVDVYHGFLTAENIAASHAAGVAVTAWTVNEVELAQRLIAWGLDALATDYPDQMLGLF